MHADEGSNPIWMTGNCAIVTRTLCNRCLLTGYDNNWYDKSDEQMSNSSGNSLDENAVGDRTTSEADTPTDSLNGSGRGSHSSINDRQALCRGIGGRLTPNNIVVPTKALHRQHQVQMAGKKPAAPRPPDKPQPEVRCNNSINTVYISSGLNQTAANNLSIINLETTEL